MNASEKAASEWRPKPSLITLYISTTVFAALGTVLMVIGSGTVAIHGPISRNAMIIYSTSLVLAGAVLIVSAIRAWKLVIFAMDSSTAARSNRICSFLVGSITYCYAIIAEGFVFLVAGVPSMD